MLKEVLREEKNNTRWSPRKKQLQNNKFVGEEQEEFFLILKFI